MFRHEVAISHAGDVVADGAVNAVFADAAAGLVADLLRMLQEVVKLEVLGGARPQDRKALEEHFSCIPYFPMTDAAWDSAKALAWRLRDKGCNVPWNDILIAALSVKAECRIYSVDKHFNLMYESGTGIVLYEPGYGGKYNPN